MSNNLSINYVANAYVVNLLTGRGEGGSKIGKIFLKLLNVYECPLIKIALKMGVRVWVVWVMGMGMGICNNLVSIVYNTHVS